MERTFFSQRSFEHHKYAQEACLGYLCHEDGLGLKDCGIILLTLQLPLPPTNFLLQVLRGINSKYTIIAWFWDSTL